MCFNTKSNGVSLFEVNKVNPTRFQAIMQKNLLCRIDKGSRQKKSSSTSGWATKRGGGVKAGPLRKTELFFIYFFYFVAI